MSQKLIKKWQSFFRPPKLFELNGFIVAVTKKSKIHYFRAYESGTLLRKLGDFDQCAKGTRVLLNYLNRTKLSSENILFMKSDFWTLLL